MATEGYALSEGDVSEQPDQLPSEYRVKRRTDMEKTKNVRKRGLTPFRSENVVYGINYYQTMGGARNPADGLFVGSSVPGMDINTELGEAHGLREGFAHVDILARTAQAQAVPGQIFE